MPNRVTTSYARNTDFRHCSHSTGDTLPNNSCFYTKLKCFNNAKEVPLEFFSLLLYVFMVC